MAELVRDGERQELVERHAPLFKELPGSIRTVTEQRLLQERLPLLEDS